MTGGHYSWRQDEYQSLNLNFVVPRGEAERDIWLRLRSFSSTFSSFEVLPESEARAIDLRQMLLAGLYQVLLFICLGWSALAWFMFRDSLIKFYLVREVVVIVYAMVIWGVWRSWGSTWAPVWWIERVSHFIMFLLGFTMVSFDAYFLRQFKPAPWLLKTLYGVSASFGFQLLVSMAGYWQEAFIINSYVLLLAIVLVFMTVLSTRAWSEPNPGQRPDFSKWLLVCMYVFLFLIVLFGRLAALGILSSGYDAFYLGMLYPLAGSVLMMALLQIRAMRRHKRHQEVQLRLHVVEQLAQDERIRREDQAHFLAMLGHELRNPLAAVGFLADSQTDEGKLIRRAVDDMTQVLERSMHVSKLGDARMAFEFTELNLHELMQEVCHRAGQPERIDLSNVQSGVAITSDGMWLSTVMANLIDNALKYSPEASVVAVHCRVIDTEPVQAIRVRVSNAPGAAGLPDPQRLFDKYYRSAQARRQIGSGLGLYLVKALLVPLGGTIEYVPVPAGDEQEVVFELRLPIRPATASG